MLVMIFSWGNYTVARKVQDQLGRNIVIPTALKRIVSLAPSLTECMFALENGNKLVGVTKYSDYPPQAVQLPKVGSYVNLDLEKIVSLQPDLCLATKDGNPIKVIDRLEELGIPVYALDPRNLSTVMETINELGQLLKAQKKSSKVVQGMKKRVELIKKRVAKTNSRPRVFFQIGSSPIVSVGSRTFIHELIKLAGGVNVAAGSVDYPRFSREEVLILNPDIIVINSMTRDQQILEWAKQRWSEFPNLPAVKKKQIYGVNSDYFNRAGPRLVKGLEILAGLFHPEMFPKAKN